jgi:hypothetical protein
MKTSFIFLFFHNSNYQFFIFLKLTSINPTHAFNLQYKAAPTISINTRKPPVTNSATAVALVDCSGLSLKIVDVLPEELFCNVGAADGFSVTMGLSSDLIVGCNVGNLFGVEVSEIGESGCDGFGVGSEILRIAI